MAEAQEQVTHNSTWEKRDSKRLERETGTDSPVKMLFLFFYMSRILQNWELCVTFTVVILQQCTSTETSEWKICYRSDTRPPP